MNKLERMVRIGVANMVVAGAIASCAPEVGATGVLPNPVRVVVNYNSLELVKETCVIPDGAEVKVLDYSTLILGGTERMSVVELSSDNCTGWLFVEDLNIVIDK